MSAFGDWMLVSWRSIAAAALRLSMLAALAGGGMASAEPSIAGTCFAVGPNGQILTANHVVARLEEIRVRFDGGKAEAATLVAASASTDIALLRISRHTPEFLPLAAPRSAQLGQRVFTLGFPLSPLLGSAMKFTEGSISALSGMGDDASWLQISVPLQPGNSGGPIVSESGEVLGLAIAKPTALLLLVLTGHVAENVGWAVKADLARPLLSEPAPRTPTATREAAIERASKAICAVVGETTDAMPTLRSDRRHTEPEPDPHASVLQPHLDSDGYPGRVTNVPEFVEPPSRDDPIGVGDCYKLPEVAAYLDQIRVRTLARWQLPPNTTPNQIVVLKFKIDPAGSATGVEVVDAADRALGQSAVDALRSASPFPAMAGRVLCLAREPITANFTNPVGGG